MYSNIKNAETERYKHLKTLDFIGKLLLDSMNTFFLLK